MRPLSFLAVAMLAMAGGLSGVVEGPRSRPVEPRPAPPPPAPKPLPPADPRAVARAMSIPPHETRQQRRARLRSKR